MKIAKNITRENIIQTTTQLIREYEDINKITIRDIALRSEVGVGLVNYHFQTKENLIDICVLRIVSQFIEEIERLYENLDMAPIDKLKYVFKAKCAFIVANPILSKTSMILDLNSASLEDNTHQAAKLHFKVLKEIYGERKSDSEIFGILHIIMSSIQFLFLRNNVLKMDTNIDFYDQEQRDRYIEYIIDYVARDI
jgi:AcrR family transcriptional regulator